MGVSTYISLSLFLCLEEWGKKGEVRECLGVKVWKGRCEAEALGQGDRGYG